MARETQQTADGSCTELETDADSVPWETVARRGATFQLDDARFSVEDVLGTIAEDLRAGDDLDADDIVRARLALNEARRMLEEILAPIAGAEEWGDPLPRLPMDRMWEASNHPKAEDQGGDDEQYSCRND